MASDLPNDDPHRRRAPVPDFDAEDSVAPEVADRDPFEEIASEFSERQRQGETPSIEEYVQRHPELAEEIRELFPTIAAMEHLKERKSPAPKATLGGLPLEQLGDFRILGEIGRGGMGIVYEAEQVSLGRRVAVKVLPKQALLDERHLRRFEREAQTAAKLHHTNIVPVFGVGQQDGYHYIVMQFIPGVGLDEILIALRSIVLDDDSRRYRMDTSSRASHVSHNAQALLDGNFSKHARSAQATSFVKEMPTGSRTGEAGRPAVTMEMLSTSVDLPPDTRSESSDTMSLDAEHRLRLSAMDKQFYHSVATIGQQVADALAYAHEQGTLHRDIKPGNLLLDATGTVWVADFGLAKLVEHENVSRTGDIVGTLSYMPPESFSGDTDARGDIYALGLTLYEMLAMRPAYYGRDRAKLVKQITDGDRPRLQKLNPSIPRDLQTIVLKAIEHRPEDRYATARELEEDLQCFLNDMPIKARRMSVPEQFTRWCRRNKLVASLSAAVLTLLVSLSVTFGVLNWQANAAQAVAERSAQRADEERKKAEQAEENAKDTADIAIQGLIAFFQNTFPDRLPLSANSSIQVADATQLAADNLTADQLAADELAADELTADELAADELTADELTADELAAEADVEAVSTQESSAATVAVAPVTEETASLLENYLTYFDTLAKRAGDEDEALALTFADLTMRVGTSHRMLGNHVKALEYFDQAIAMYERLVPRNGAPTAIIGLARTYNEKGDVVALTSDPSEARMIYQNSLDLLAEHETQLAAVPRATYERARTLFLMSVQRRMRPSPPSGGRGGHRLASGDNGRREPDRGANGRERGGSGRFDLRGARSNLQQAIELLTPLVESETFPEYRYLLARCYTGLTGLGPWTRRHDENEQQQQSIREAMKLLEQLVAEQPGVADYKFEFAITKTFSLALLPYDRAQRVTVAEEILALADEIAGRNPGVSNYAMLQWRAVLMLTHTLDQLADERRRSEDPEELELRRRASESARRAVQVVARARERFAESMAAEAGRLPRDSELDYLEVSARVNYLIAQAVDHKRRGEGPLADPLLEQARAAIRTWVDSEIAQVSESERGGPRGSRRGGRFESFRLLGAIETESKGLDSAIQLLKSIKRKRLAAMEETLGREPTPAEQIELDLHLSSVLRHIGADEQADQLLIAATKRLNVLLDESQTRDPRGRWELRAVASLCMQVLRERGSREGIPNLELPPFRGPGGGRRGGPRR